MSDVLGITSGSDIIQFGSQDWQDAVLSSDPFEGDFLDGSLLSDKIVKVRSTKKTCNMCLSILEPGTYTRSVVLSEGNQLHNIKFCQSCSSCHGYGEFLYEGNRYIEDIDEEYEKDENFIEPKLMYDIAEEVRAENEKFLISKFGNRYFEVGYKLIYDALKSK